MNEDGVKSSFEAIFCGIIVLANLLLLLVEETSEFVFIYLMLSLSGEEWRSRFGSLRGGLVLSSLFDNTFEIVDTSLVIKVMWFSFALPKGNVE